MLNKKIILTLFLVVSVYLVNAQDNQTCDTFIGPLVAPPGIGSQYSATISRHLHHYDTDIDDASTHLDIMKKVSGSDNTRYDGSEQAQRVR